MKIFLTGATGFTGSRVLAFLRGQGRRVRCLVRTPSAASHLQATGAETALGDLGRVEALADAMRGCDVLLNVASLGFGHARGVVEAAQASGIARGVFVSTTGIFTQLNPASKSVRLAAEETIQHSALNWTILRPTMIYGSGRDRNMCRLVRFLSASPIMPVIGPGESLLQPIFVDDLARAIVDVADCRAASRQAYNLSGAAPLTFNDVIAITSRLMGRRIRRLHLPVAPAVFFLRGIERLPVKFPIKAEQILRLNEDKAFSHAEAARDFGFRPLDFAEGMRRELASLGRLRA